MDNYIIDLCLKWNHPNPKKRKLSPYKHIPIVYGAKIKYAMDPPFSVPLDNKGVLYVQSIVGALLYYAQAIGNKLFVGLNKLGQQQASSTKDTNAALLQLLNYLATYPNDGILYQASGMGLSVHSDAAYLNVRKSRSRSGAHIMLSEDTPVLTRNGPVLTVAQIIKFFMSSDVQSEISGLFICAKAIVQLRHSLIEIGWPNLKSPIQFDNSTTVWVANDTIIQCKTKTMNMQYHWLRFREAQGQFRFFRAPGDNNLANYRTKNHLPLYHEAHRPI